jgi:hypothetical protein
LRLLRNNLLSDLCVNLSVLGVKNYFNAESAERNAEIAEQTCRNSLVSLETKLVSSRYLHVADGLGCLREIILTQSRQGRKGGSRRFREEMQIKTLTNLGVKKPIS